MAGAEKHRDDPVEACAAIADAWSRKDALRLACGEMTAQELRTAQAVARAIAADIRRLKPDAAT